MTDNEIIKTLEYCKDIYSDCEMCPAYRECEEDTARMIGNVLDLINRQKAEIERLQKEIEVKDKIYQRNTGLRERRIFDLMDELKTSKSEAIKEFAERLKTARVEHTSFSQNHWYEIDDTFINELVAEMTEVDNER